MPPTIRNHRQSIYTKLIRGATSAAVCCGVVFVSSGRAESAGSRPPHHTAQQTSLSPQQRVLHALNRLTFGPTPGQAAVVRRIGVDAWIQQQLHPDQIPDSGLEARLAQFPAMQLPQQELVTRFPSPQMIRQYTRRDMDPSDGSAVEHAIYADASFRYENKVEAKQAKQDGPPAPQSGGTAAEPASPLPQVERMDPVLVKQILALPPQQRFARLIALPPAQMQALDLALRGGAREQLTLGLPPEQAEEIAALGRPAQVVNEEVVAARLLRDVYSQRQLQAVMTDFWLNHFNVYLRKDGNEPYLLPAYEREAVLPHALGHFEDLLVATARSPAMLVYLDNRTSVGPNSPAALRAGGTPSAHPKKADKGINENYARELMELHTLGVNGGYTQQDVIEVAKCFTGWTVAPLASGGGFFFDPDRHEPGPKTVLGYTIPEGGENEGLAVLHILATSPATAHLLSLQLAQRFVSDNPSPALVERMAAAYLRSDGDISSVLEAMFHSPEFWSPKVYRDKVKTPLEFVVSALRASDADVVHPLPLVQAMARLGMPVYGMQTPNGYSWQNDAWINSGALLNRMNFALTLSGNRLRGTRVAWSDAEPDPTEEARLESQLLGEPATAHTRAAVLATASQTGAQSSAAAQFAALPVRAGEVEEETHLRRVGEPQVWPVSAPEQPAATMAGLLLGSPEFQRR